MNENVFTLVPRTPINKDGALRALDHLRALIESGEVVVFAAVGLSPNDQVQVVVGGGNKTKVQVMGAIDFLGKAYWQQG